MENLDLLIASIKDQAQKQKDEILTEAREKRDKIIGDCEEKGKNQAQKILADAKKEAERLVENSKVTAQRQARDIKIEAKNSVISKVISRLEQRLIKMGPNHYQKFVKNALKEIDIEDGEILLQKDMKYHFKKEDFPKLTISDETVDGGFIVRKGNIKYDISYKSLIDFNKDELEKIIAEKIFK